MTYRDPAPVQCETCLNKKTRSPKMPMSDNTKTALTIIGIGGGAVGLLAAAMIGLIDYLCQQSAVFAHGARFDRFETAAASVIAFSICVGISLLAAGINRLTD